MTTPIPTPVVPTPVDLIMSFARGVAWPPREAFAAALLLLKHGVSVAEARQMFEHCERWRRVTVAAGETSAQ